MIELYTVGGYNEVGKNMSVIRVDDEAIILDMGLQVEKYVRYTEREDIPEITASKLTQVGAIPDISLIKELKPKIKAIIPTHAHLDHVGAIPFLSNRFRAEILCTPFTASVIKAILKDEKIKLVNEVKKINVNSIYRLSDKIKIEFINMTHSTPQTVMVAIHTKEGMILYANDFKFDLHPVLGKKPNFKRLKEIGKEGVLALIVDCIRAGEDRKTPSERVAKELLMDVLLGTESKGKAVIVTTFSSHLARLKSIVDIGKRMRRRIVFFGRSLAKYIGAGEEAGIITFSKDVKIVKYGNQIKKELKKIMQKGKEKYLLVVTGHQGEPKAVLSKIAKREFPFLLDKEDQVIFSCTVIPTKLNQENRSNLENELREANIRIFKDIHVSGHAAREDLRDLINIVKPKWIIPAHGNKNMASELVDLAVKMGYLQKNIRPMQDGEKLELKP